MLYHQITSNNPIEIFLNLEELVFLSSVLRQECFIIPNEEANQYMDLSYFTVVDYFPENIIKFDISDYVCMYHDDFVDIEGSDFLSYRRNQEKIYTRLDKFHNNDYHLIFAKPNYYETKYFVCDANLYKQAKHKTLNYQINFEFKNKFEYLTHILPRQPLLCLDDHVLKDVKLPFNDFYYIYSGDIDLNKDCFDQYNALDLKSYLMGYHQSLREVDFNMLICSVSDVFTDLYGFSNDLLYGVLSKWQFIKDDSWQVNLLKAPKGGMLDGFHLKEVEPNNIFDFGKKNLNCHRSELMSLIRFRDCGIND